MAKNSKQTSRQVAHIAAEVMHDPNRSHDVKSLAASALGQKGSSKQTGKAVEHIASKVMQDGRFGADAKTLAASVLAQSNKDR